MPDLGSLISHFMADAATSGLYTREQVQQLRAHLAHVVASDLGTHDVGAVRGRHVQALVDELRAAGVSASRVDAIVEALRLAFAYAVGRGLVSSSPLVGLAPRGRPTPSPTTAMLALGERAVAWTVRGVVVAFVVAAVGLVLAVA